MFPSNKWRHVLLCSTKTMPQHPHFVCGSRVMDCQRPAKSPSSSPPSHISPNISTPASSSSPSPSSVSSSNGLHVSTQPFLSSVNHGAWSQGWTSGWVGTPADRGETPDIRLLCSLLQIWCSECEYGCIVAPFSVLHIHHGLKSNVEMWDESVVRGWCWKDSGGRFKQWSYLSVLCT